MVSSVELKLKTLPFFVFSYLVFILLMLVPSNDYKFSFSLMSWYLLATILFFLWGSGIKNIIKTNGLIFFILVCKQSQICHSDVNL